MTAPSLPAVIAELEALRADADRLVFSDTEEAEIAWAKFKGAAVSYNAILLAAAKEAERMLEQERFRHKKRGSTYTIVGRGFAQCAEHPIEEMTCVVIYRAERNGALWVRNAMEFDDGRFEPLPTPPEAGKTTP